MQCVHVRACVCVGVRVGGARGVGVGVWEVNLPGNLTSNCIGGKAF